MRLKEVRFKIGDLVLALHCVDDQVDFEIEESYQKFTTSEPAQVILSHRWQDPPGLEDWQKIFDSQGVWRLYQKGDKLAVALFSPVFGALPYQLAIFEPDFLFGEIYTSRRDFQALPFPLRYPLAEIVMINLLGQGRGLLLHACAVQDGAGALLFSGKSGDGKSTTARLWQDQPGMTLLSDDRVILVKHEDTLWIYGTPWHGDARVASPAGAPLEKIFILRHGPANDARQLSPLDLAARLFVRCFPPFWDFQGLQYSLQLLDELSQRVAGYELSFVPDSSAIEYVKWLRST